MKNIGNMKGLMKNYTPVHCVSWNPNSLQNLKYLTVIEFHFFNRITKRKKKNMNNLRKLLLQVLHV